MKNLKAYFSYSGFQGDALEQIVNSFIPKDYKKGEHFVQDGQIGNHLGFVEKGLFQYYLALDGEEKTTYTCSDNSLIVSLVSLFKQIPSRINIRALKKSKVYLIDKKSLLELQKEVPGFKDFYIALIEWQIGCIDETRLDAITLTPTQRYQKLLENEPHLLQEVPLKYIASILGVTERHLSRIRKTI